MMITPDFARAFTYDAWANRRTLQALRQVSHLDDRSREVMAHVLGAQKVWLTRLRGEDTSALAVWPQLTLDQCEPLLEENASAYQQFLSTLSPEHLGHVLAYRTSTGVDFRTSVADILTQVLLHGSYHRGQLATSVKRHGGTPPVTDFVVFARES